MHVRLPAPPPPPPVPMVMVQMPPQSAPQPEPDPDVQIHEAEPEWNTAHTMKEAPDPRELIPCCGCCCTIISCYCKWPECCGYYAKGNFVCIETEAICCKTGKREGSLCVCIRNELEIIQPTTCCKMECQPCCIDERCAIPCDKEVPCIVSVCGLTIVQDYKFVCDFAKAMRPQ